MPSFDRGAVDYCRWLTRTARSHFALGLKLLPPARREAMEIFYAFCRAVDDLVDRPSVHASTGSARTDGMNHSKEAVHPEALEGERPVERKFIERELSLWRRQMAAAANGFPSHPIAVAFQPVIRRYQIPLGRPLAIVDGVEMDLTRRRYAAFDPLRIYCEHVASAVGLVSIRIFGCTHPASENYAVDLGIALQLTNIARDVKTDAERGRIYLPQDELKKFGVSEEEILRGEFSDSFRRLMTFQCERARSFFHKAAASLKESGESRKLLPARIMGAVYFQLLRHIEQADYNVFSTKIRVPRQKQIGIAFREIFR